MQVLAPVLAANERAEMARKARMASHASNVVQIGSGFGLVWLCLGFRWILAFWRIQIG